MRPIHQVLRPKVVLGKIGDRSVVRVQEKLLGSLSLGSTADRRSTAGVDARRPTGVLEQRRAAEVQKCADKGWKSALICLGNMRKGGVSPGSAAYNVALKACAGAGEWDRAAALVEDMEGSGATPDHSVLKEITVAMKPHGGRAVSLGDASAAAAGAAPFEGEDMSCDSASSGSSTSFGSSGSGSGGRKGNHGGSVAGMHTFAMVGGGDGVWDSRHSPPNDWNGGTLAGFGFRSLTDVRWGQGRS